MATTDRAVPPAASPPDPPQKEGRAGRDLPAAIGVGLGLGGLIVASLFVYRPAFVVVLGVTAAIAVWELCRALRAGSPRPPLVPILLGGLAMDAVAWSEHAEALVVTFLLTCVAVVVWRLADGPEGYLADVTAGVLVALYVPFLAGFAVLLAVPGNGARQVIVFIATAVCSDVGGYATGVFLGRHPMAPSVSPAKSWEGFAGSLVLCAAAGVALLTLLLHRTVWQGAVFGLAIAVTATLGDLGESLLKRDLGVKDMGKLLPGHGGVMDRLDSLLPAAAVSYLLLTAFAH